MTGYPNIKVYMALSGQNRTDFSKKGVIVNVSNGSRLDSCRGAFPELSTARRSPIFRQQANSAIQHLLRVR